MTDAGTPQLDPTKVRIGLAIVTVVVVVCIVLAFTADAVVVKALMFAIACTAFVRAFLLTRALRRERPES